MMMPDVGMCFGFVLLAMALLLAFLDVPRGRK